MNIWLTNLAMHVTGAGFTSALKMSSVCNRDIREETLHFLYDDDSIYRVFFLTGAPLKVVSVFR